MTTDTMVKVDVNKYDIKHSNFNDNPISVAIARTFSLNAEYVQAQRHSIIIFDEHDQIESAWKVEESRQLCEFLDSWDLRTIGKDIELEEFSFTIQKK
jgi:hypothetical protein